MSLIVSVIVIAFDTNDGVDHTVMVNLNFLIEVDEKLNHGASTIRTYGVVP